MANYLVPAEVADPLEKGATLIVMRSLRDDPLQRLFSHHQITISQLEAGRAFQRDFELAERGPRAVDPSRPFTDGGLPPEAITEAMRKAARSLAGVYRLLGQSGSALAHDALIHRKTMEQIAEARGLSGRRWVEFFGHRLREVLDSLSVFYGFAMPGR